MLELLQRWSRLQPKVCRAMPSGTEFWCGDTLVCTSAIGPAQRGAVLVAVEEAILVDCFGCSYGVNHESGHWAQVASASGGDRMLAYGPSTAEALLLAWVTYLEG